MKNSDYIKINSSTEEKNGNKYLTFASTDKKRFKKVCKTLR